MKGQSPAGWLKRFDRQQSIADAVFFYERCECRLIMQFFKFRIK